MTGRASVMTSTEKRDKGLAMWLDGETNLAEIARQCDVSRSCVGKWVLGWKSSKQLSERAELARQEGVTQMLATLHTARRYLDEKVTSAYTDSHKIKEVLDFLLEIKGRGLYDDYADKLAQLDQAIATLSNCQDISPGELTKIIGTLSDRVLASEARANGDGEQMQIILEDEVEGMAV